MISNNDTLWYMGPTGMTDRDLVVIATLDILSSRTKAGHITPSWRPAYAEAKSIVDKANEDFPM